MAAAVRAATAAVVMLIEPVSAAVLAVLLLGGWAQRSWKPPWCGQHRSRTAPAGSPL
jgi:hypothetical protein